MKLLRTSLLAIVLLCFATSCQKDEDTLPNPENYTIDISLAEQTNWELAAEVLELVNEHRSTMDLTPIKKDQQYASAYAVEHTLYMIDVHGINHDNFTYRSAGLQSRGATHVGENVAYGYNTAEDLVHAWLNSPSHKKIIEGDFTHSGFGILKNDSGAYFFTQLFYKK